MGGLSLVLRCVVDVVRGESEFGWNSAISAWNYEYQLTASCRKFSFLPDFLPRISGWCSWKCVREPDLLLTDEGMVAAN